MKLLQMDHVRGSADAGIPGTSRGQDGSSGTYGPDVACHQRTSHSPRSLSPEKPNSHYVPSAISSPEGSLQISLSKYRQLLPSLHKSPYQF